jgi:integrase
VSRAERDKRVTRNVGDLVQIPTPRYKVGRGLQVAEVTKLLVEAKKTRLYALYVVAATSGLRRGELLGLRREDLDLYRALSRWPRQRNGWREVGRRRQVGGLRRQGAASEDHLAELLAHRDRQDKERIETGEDLWREHD